MPEFNSPLGKQRFAGQPMREVDIPDESAGPPQYVRPGPRQEMPQLDEAAFRDFNSRMGAPPDLPQAGPEMGDLEREIKQAKEARRRGQERLGDAARRRIEMLIGMTRGVRPFDIDGNKYVLQTLKSGELREAILQASQFDGTVESPFEIRKQLLARSLVQIAGVDVEQFLGSNSLDARLAFMDELDHYLLGRLYDEYLVMVEEARAKYSIKNETDAKEVVEDLKK